MEQSSPHKHTFDGFFAHSYTTSTLPMLSLYTPRGYYYVCVRGGGRDWNDVGGREFAAYMCTTRYMHNIFVGCLYGEQWYVSRSTRMHAHRRLSNGGKIAAGSRAKYIIAIDRRHIVWIYVVRRMHVYWDRNALYAEAVIQLSLKSKLSMRFHASLPGWLCVFCHIRYYFYWKKMRCDRGVAPITLHPRNFTWLMDLYTTMPAISALWYPFPDNLPRAMPTLGQL